MKKTYRVCLRRLQDISHIGSAAGLASWDQETMMPAEAAPMRAEQLAALSDVLHEKFVSPSIGRDLKSLHRRPQGLTADERVCVREWLRDYERATKIPTELVRELARVGSLAQSAWVAARKHSDFKAFAPWLEKLVVLRRREADALGHGGVRYDAMLDAYEPRMTTAELSPIMAELSEGLVPLIASIRDVRARAEKNVFSRSYAEEGQERLCREMMLTLGLRPGASRLDRSAHPFCIGLAPGDVRITTRFATRWLPQALYGVMHETGHALYDQGMDARRFGTPLCEAASVGVHESQSRLWENMVGRSRPFMDFLLKRLRRLFPAQMRGVTPDALYRAINRVKPSPIRVEADEVTYNLHIVLRYEIEVALLAGDVKVRELPALWNERMRHYFGITPKNDAEGVLQDTHWGSGRFGYFPTYALGNIYAAQLWERMRRDIPAIEAKMAGGRFAPLLAWLRSRIHRHGRRYEPAELIRRASGRTPSARSFLQYLRTKYSELYGLGLS